MKSIINIPESLVDLFCGIAGADEFVYPDHQHLLDNASKLQGSHLVINSHTFPRFPLPNEADQQNERPHIIIGADIDHTPDFLINVAVDLFEGVGLKVAVNPAFPTAQESCETDIIISVGVRDDLYIDKAGGRKSDFDLVKWKIQSALDRLVILGNAGLYH